MGYKTILYEVKDNIGYLTLNRPERLNAVNPAMQLEIADLFGKMRSDPEVRVAIITGNGRYFSSGRDIKDTSHAQAQPSVEDLYQGTSTSALGDAMFAFDKPLIAAINGPALGAGFSLCVLSDMLIASETAQLGFYQLRYGFFPMQACSVKLARAIGTPLASEMIFTGKLIDAQEAYRIGLVNKVVSKDQVMPAAEELAKTIASLPSPLALRAAKHTLTMGRELTRDQEAYIETFTHYLISQKKEVKEAEQAFLERKTRL